jgi:transposase, IS30 family
MAQKQECRKWQLTQEERVKIYWFLQLNLSFREMWRRLWCPHTTVSREIDRNSIDKWRWILEYCPIKAENERLKRRYKANQKHIILWRDRKQRDILEEKLKELWENWWPDEILWRVKDELWREIVSTATFYRFIREYKPILQRYLRYKQKWYKTYKKWNKRKKMYDDVPNIKERPEIINERWRIWDWEADTVVSGKINKGWVVTLVDRKSRYYLIKKVWNLKAETINMAINSMLIWETVKSMTFDNWTEFSNIWNLKWQCFRADPYASWQRWSNEKHNGFFRRYVWKWVNINEYTDKEIQKIQDRINHKPRKILGYKTPYEVYHNINLKYIT